MMKNIKPFLYGAIAFLLASNYIQCDRNNKAAETLQMFEALSDTLRQITNELGQQESEITSLAATSRKTFLKINSSDSLINQLQGLVRRYGSSTGIIHTVETTVRDTGETVIVRDTVTNEIRWPVGAVINDDYVSAMVRAWPGYSSWKITTKDTFDYSLNKLKTGFLGMGPAKYTIRAINRNPYSKTSGLRSFTLTENRPRVHLGINAGYGVFGNDTGISAGWHLGIGLNYSFISF